MATTDESSDLATSECKPSGRPRFSRPWMAGFLLDARRTGDIPAALERADAGWGDYYQSRAEDLAFDGECGVLDQVVRQKTVTTLEALASTGNLGAAKLLLKQLLAVRREIAELIEQGEGRPASPAAQVEGRDACPVGPCKDCWDGLHAECPHCGVPVVMVHRSVPDADLPIVVDKTAEAKVSRFSVVRDGDRPRDLARFEAEDRRRRLFHQLEDRPDDREPGPGPEPLMSPGWRPHPTEQDQYEQVNDDQGGARFRRIRLGG